MTRQTRCCLLLLVLAALPLAGCGSSNSDAELVANPLSGKVFRETFLILQLVAGPPIGQVISYEVGTEPENGSVDIEDDIAIYSPDPGFVGFDSFTYIALTDQRTSEPAPVSVEVTLDPDDNPITPVNEVLARQQTGDFDDDPVLLRGTVTARIVSNDYTFVDATGSVTVRSDRDVLPIGVNLVIVGEIESDSVEVLNWAVLN